MKSIKELSWDVSDEEYRNNPSINYSSLAWFSRCGPSIIPHLYDKQESESLVFGSLVDCLITDIDNFDNLFHVTNIPKLSDSLINITKNLYNIHKNDFDSINLIPRDNILIQAISENYYSNWKDETRINRIISECSDYYKTLYLSGNKIIISQDEYDSAVNCVKELYSNEFTKEFFVNDLPNRNIERQYQLKFKLITEDFNVKCKFDMLYVDHDLKIITPIDIKTTSKHEEDFESSFVKWGYYIQSSLYDCILRHVCENDEYFKDFSIVPFTFICINKENLAPICWVDNNSWGRSMVDKCGNEYKGWMELYGEFQWHVKHKEYKYSHDTVKKRGSRRITILNPIINERK